MKAKDIVSVMGELGFATNCIRQSDRWIAAACPFALWTHPKRKDGRASFGISVNEDGPSGYNCLSCGEHGNVAGLVERLADLRDCDYTELAQRVDDLETVTTFPPWESRPKAVRELPEPIDEDEFNDTYPAAVDVKMARRYLKSRSVLLDSADYYDIRWDDYRKRLLFKVKQDGVLYGMSGRSVDPQSKMKVKVYRHQPTNLFLVGEEKVDHKDEDRPVVVIEGLMGLLELDSCSLFDYADAVCTQGASLSAEQAERLTQWGKRVVIMYDPDEAGRKGTYGCTLASGRKKIGAVEMLRGLVEVHAAKWPEDVYDTKDLSESELHRMVMKTWSFCD